MVALDAVHHVSFTVGDMERSLAFYRDLLGLDVIHDWVTEADYLRTMIPFPGLKLRIAFLQFPGSDLRLELIQYLEPAGVARDLPTNVPGAAHVCFNVSDLQAAYREMVGRGVRFNSPPVLITSQANYGSYGCYLTDPDGITIELRQPPPA